MDEEELEQPKNKITLSSFFESIAAVEKVANHALSIANSNLNLIQEQKSLIDALSLSIEGLKSDIQEVNNYITIEKNEASDKLVETQDDKQKQMISERLQGLQGEKGEKGEKSAAAPSESARLKSENEEKKQLKEFINDVIDEREQKKENERKDELREKEDAEQKKEQSEKLESKSEGGIKASVTNALGIGGGGGGSTGGKGGDKKQGLFSLLKNPLALGALGIGGIASLFQLPKMLMGMGGAALGGGRGVTGAAGGVADALTGGLFDFDGRSGGGVLKKMFGGKKDDDKEGEELSKKGKVEETGTGKDKKDKKGMTPYDFIQEKGLEIKDTESMFERVVHVYNPDVQDKDGNYQGIKVSGTFQKKDKVSTEQFINAHEGFKIKELRGIVKDRRKKENKLMDFVKQGGVAGFLGRKLFGGKDDKEDKKSKKDMLGTGLKEEKIPKSKYEQLIDAGYTFDDLGFIGGSRNITYKGPNDGKETFFSKGLGGILGIGNRGRYKRVENQSGSRTILGKGSGDSLEDIINRDESLTLPEGRSLRSKILGGIDAATGNITDFDQEGGKVTGLSRLLGGTIDAATGNFTDIDKEGGSTFGLTRGITGIADALTGNALDLDKKGDFGEGIKRAAGGFADFATLGTFDFDKKNKKGSPKGWGLKRIVGGLADSATMGLTDFDKRGAGLLQFDALNFGEKGKKDDTNESKNKISKELKIGKKTFDLSESMGGLSREEYDALSNKDRGILNRRLSIYAKQNKGVTKSTDDNIKPVIESEDKNISQKTLSSIDTSSPQIITMPGANEQSSKKNVIAPNNSLQVDASDIKPTSSSSSWVHTISNNVLTSSKKTKNLPPLIATMLK